MYVLAGVTAYSAALLVGAPMARSKEPGAKTLKAKEAITYAKQVARIVQEKCQICHHPGTAAPFALVTYDDVVKQADNIREAVADKRMPPWHADPRFGKFGNERRLSRAELDALLTWLDSGRELGDPRDLPEPRAYADGWVIGKPDVVFELPEERTIPATGVVPYQYYRTPTNFKEDVWVQAAEGRPSNRGVVHHIVVSISDPRNKGQGSANRGFGESILAGEAPGDIPLILPPGVAKRIPAGAELIWQMHYTPNGKEAKDRSQLGLVFYKGKEPPKHDCQTLGIAENSFVIPPGESNHRVESDWTAPRDTLLLSFMPHMHLRGKDFEYRAEFPDGRQETILSVPHYDFSWQTQYRLAEPLRLPKGTKVHCTAHFDNSAANPANPDPKVAVRYGEQTWEEMMIGWVDFVWQQPDREAVLEGFRAF
jgi:mono/diheme cytochrome c family protein